MTVGSTYMQFVVLIVIDNMRGSRNFCQGVPGPTARKQPEQSFFLIQLILQFTEGANSFITEKTILFQGSRGGPTFSRGGGGPTFSRGDPNANFYRNPYN